jgi:ribonuclease R
MRPIYPDSLNRTAMKFTVADLLDQLSATDWLSLVKFQKALSLSTDLELEQLDIALEALTRLALVESSAEGWRRLETPDLVAARLRCSTKGFCFALREDGEEDIYIRDHQLNHAWNGDRVLVRITREGARRRSPEGGVVCILERHATSLLAQVEEQDGRLLAVPLDDRLLTTVELTPADVQHLAHRQEQLVEVHIDRFPVGQFAPKGHVARSLPVRGGEAADKDLLLVRHHLQSLPAPPRATLRTPVEKGREDLTGLPTLLPRGWSGANAPILPALSLEEREGGWRLWLHAPAVAERFPIGGPLDCWLRQQAETLSAGSQWLPLLSPALAKAAAFDVGIAQAAVSVALDLDANGALEHYRFCLSQIKPDAALTVEVMAALAERKPKARTVPSALKTLKDHLPLVDQLVSLTTLVRQIRQASGAIDLDLPVPPLPSLADLQVPPPDATPQGWLVALAADHPISLLRETVLLAHRALGRHMAALELPALFALNEAPDQGELNEVARMAVALDIPLELGAEGQAKAVDLLPLIMASDRCRALQQQLREALQPLRYGAQPGENALAAETLAFAPWSCASLHYGDIFNQHLLVSLLVDGKDRPTVRHKVAVEVAADSCHGAIDWALLTPSQLAPFQDSLSHGLANRLNGRCRFAQEFQDDVVSMAQARAAEPLVGQTLPGRISGVQSYGFFVEVPPSQVEGLVHVSSLKDDWYEYRSRQNQLVGRRSRRTYLLGDMVEVEIQQVDALRNQIDLVVDQTASTPPEGVDEPSPLSLPPEAVEQGQLALAES